MTIEKIFELLIFLLQKTQEEKVSEIDFSQLEKNGYTKSEINAAFSFLLAKNESKDLPKKQAETQTSTSHRTFHEVEKLVIDTNARGYLFQLRQLGLINDLEMEHIIEQIMMMDASKITVNDIKAIASAIFFENNNINLWKARDIFLNNETIN